MNQVQYNYKLDLICSPPNLFIRIFDLHSCIEKHEKMKERGFEVALLVLLCNTEDSRYTVAQTFVKGNTVVMMLRGTGNWTLSDTILK